MKHKSFLIIVSFLCWIYLPAQNHISSNVKLPAHPRLLLMQGEEKGLIKNIQENDFWNKKHSPLLKKADSILLLPELTYKKTGKRLLPISREAFHRMFLLSYSHRITSDRKYLDKCKKEMLAVCKFQDWNPSHFLDVAEMAMGLSIGYDWLYHHLDDNTKAVIRKNLIEKAINPSLLPENNSWLVKTNNWNQVCNTGMLFASLAVHEHYPQLSTQIINRSINSILLSMDSYAPEGAYPEGYGYWHYGTTFNVLFIDALEKAFGKDFGLTEMPGFLKSAKYIQHMISPNMNSYNYSDVDLKPRLNIAVFWLANKTKDYSLLWNELMQLNDDDFFINSLSERFIPAMFLWGSNIKPELITKPNDNEFLANGLTPVWLFRSDWNNKGASYVGFKTGTPSSGHSHMDIGSFVFEALGERWSVELGANDYNTLELGGLDIWNMTQESDRWQVYRYNNQAHSTLSINNKHQDVLGYATIDNEIETSFFKGVTSNLTPIYANEVRKCTGQ